MIIYCIDLRNYIQDSKARLYFSDTKTEEIVKDLAKTAHLSVPEYIRQVSTNSSIMRMMTVVDWMEKNFPVYRREMQQADLIGLHDKYGNESIDSEKVEKELSKRNTIDPDKDFEIIIKSSVKKESA